MSNNHLLLVLPVIVIGLGMGIYLSRVKEDSREKIRLVLFWLLFIGSIVSILLLLLLFYNTHNYAYLYKISLPVVTIVLLSNIYAQKNNQDSKKNK